VAAVAVREGVGGRLGELRGEAARDGAGGEVGGGRDGEKTSGAGVLPRISRRRRPEYGADGASINVARACGQRSEGKRAGRKEEKVPH